MRRFAGRFELECPAGTGAMGEVWRALDTTTGATVALKLALAGADLRRFAREVRLLASINHPAVVRYVAHGEAENRAFLAMEWLDGEDLAARLSRGPLSEKDALALLRRVASGAAAVHERAIVHRDLKPANVFLVDGDLARAKLLDFGIARAPESTNTARGTLIGTPAYMSPEQAAGDADLDASTDVFALGCIYFECITGRTPFVGEHAIAVLAKLLFERPPPLESIVPGADPNASALAATLLCKSPALRPRDAAAVVELIDRLAAGESLPRSLDAGLGTHERRVATVVLWQSGPGQLDAHGGAPADETARDRTDAHRLADGSSILLLSKLGTPRDHVMAACRHARALVASGSAVRLAIATDRAVDVAARALGPAIDRASALLAGVPRGEIALDEASAALARDRYDCEPFGGAGFLLRHEIDRRDAAAGEGGRLLLGRDRELALIDALVEDARTGRAGALFIVGEAGLGKSSLAREIRRRLEAREPPVSVLLGTVEALDAHVPYKALFGLLQWETDEARLGASLRAIRAGLTPIHDDVSFELGAWLVELAREAPLVAILDDTHWADEPSVRALARALRDHERAPILLAFQGRPGAVERFGDVVAPLQPVEIRLRPLAPKLARTLVDDLAGEDMDAATREAVVARGEGNPYVLDELVRATKRGPVDQLPPGVAGLLQASIDRLPVEVRRVLRACSVLGQRFTVSAARAVLGDTAGEDIVTAALAAAVEAEVVTETAGDVIAFRHALARDAVYEMLLDGERASAHGRAARWLESQGDAKAAVIAHHYAEAGERARAAALYRLAAEESLASGDRGAAEIIQRQLERIAPRSSERVDVLLLLAGPTSSGGETQRLDSAKLVLSLMGSDDPRRALALANLTASDRSPSSLLKAVAELETMVVDPSRTEVSRAAAMVMQRALLSGQRDVFARMKIVLGRHCAAYPFTSAGIYYRLHCRELETALQLAERHLEAARSEQGRRVATIWLLHVLTHLGRLDEAGDVLESEACRAVPERSSDGVSLAIARSSILAARGSLPLAIEACRGAVATIERIARRPDRESCRVALLLAGLLVPGGPAEALAIIEGLDGVLETMQQLRPVADTQRAIALFEMGRGADAERAARCGLEGMHPDWQFEGPAFRARAQCADVLRRCGAQSDARREAGAALAEIATYLAGVAPQRRAQYVAFAPGVAGALALGRDLGLEPEVSRIRGVAGVDGI